MAKLASVTASQSDEGEWISPGLEFDDIEILTRPYTDAYHDAQRAKLFKTAKAYGGDVNRIPEAVRRKIGAECLMRHVTLGIRNLQDEGGTDVTFDRLKDMVFEKRFGPLLDACYSAANIASARREGDVETAAGNSAPPSA